MGRLKRCIECGSSKLVKRRKDFMFEVENPGYVKVKQGCLECSNCGKSYFDNNEINQLSKKIMKKLR